MLHCIPFLFPLSNNLFKNNLVMRKKTRFLVFLVFLFSAVASAQTVKGIVTDNQKEPLIGVSIVVKNTPKGTNTDENGQFSLQVSENDVLVFSYIGFKTKEVKVGKHTTLNILLESDAEALDEVLIVGSRAGGRTKVDSPVPVDVFDVVKTVKTQPQVNINQILNSIAPSFTSTPQVVTDGTDHLDPAQLRGLGPDQTLVLLNGKRRHTSAFINVNGAPGRGTVGTDLNAIPSFALSKIEILRDGASAQYGSDAIAGVLNLNLKKEKGLSAQVSYGANITPKANDHRGDYDGEQGQLDLNYGTDLGKKGGFINFTFSAQFRNPTFRAGTFDGTIFNAYNAIEQRALEAGDNLSNYFSNSNVNADPQLLGLIKNYAGEVSYFNSSFLSQIQNATSLTSLRSILSKDVTDDELAYRQLTRKDFNMHVGQSRLRGTQYFLNTELPISDSWKFYAFGGQSYRYGEAGGFFRRPNQARTFTGLHPNGYLPWITTDIQDSSISAGFKGEAGAWHIDISNTFGRNEFAYTIKHTGNTSLRFASPSSFDAGKLRFLQNTLNLDFSRALNLFEKANLSLGAEQRHEAYSIVAGDESSYATYDLLGRVQDGNTPNNQKPTDFFGAYLPGGAQVFSGLREESALTKTRNVWAGYSEFETDITRWLLANAALRYENYSDFGDTFNYKLATRVKLLPNVNLRAAASTGFRAPSIHQLYYTNIGTLYLNGNLQETGTFNNISKAAELFGIEKLKEEQSKSVSAGFALNLPKAGISLSADAYFIRVDNRIILTETFSKPTGSSPAENELKQIFDTANVNSVQFFANGVDAETKGIDVVIAHHYQGDKWSINNDFGLNLTKTRKVGTIHTPEAIKNAGLETKFFSERARIYLEEAVPRFKATLSHNLSIGKWNAYLRNTYYGKTTGPDIIRTADQIGDFEFDSYGHQVIRGKLITDLSIAYNFSEKATLTLGVNNLFDLYPEKNVKVNNNNDQFVYSRATSQFGLNGRYVFARASFKLF